MDRIRFIGENCLGAIAIYNIYKKAPAATVKDYVVQEGFLLFNLDVIDEDVWQVTGEGDDSPDFIFIDLVSCHFQQLH